MANKASASNKNNIIIHNVVNAETKKRKQRRRQYQTMQAPQMLQAPQQATQMPPQIFQSGADPDLVKAIRDTVSSQAAMLNEFQDQRQREQETLAAGINALRIPDVRSNEDTPMTQGQSPAAQSAEDRGIPVVQRHTDKFQDVTVKNPERVRAGIEAARTRRARQEEQIRQAEEAARRQGFLAAREMNERRAQRDQREGAVRFVEDLDLQKFVE